MPVKVSTGLPNCREGRQNLIGSVNCGVILQTAQLAEELGYYSLWPNEFVVPDVSVTSRYADVPQLFDTVVTMAYVMAHTERIRIMPSTIVLPHHEPIILSRELATLDHFSGGRVTLGIGLGGAAEEFRRLHRTLGRSNRGRIMDEYVAALRAIWSDGPATYHGQYTSFADVNIHPKPVQNPLPIFMAGHAEGVFRRLATYGQGWIDSSMLPNELASTIIRIRRLFEEAGRGDDELEVARQFYVSIAPTEDEAIANYEAAMPASTTPQSHDDASSTVATHQQESSLIGAPEQVRERLNEYLASGATELCIIYYSADISAAERQMRLFAEEVLPALEG